MTTRILRSMALAFGLALALSPLAFGQPSTQTPTAPANASSARNVASGEKMKLKGVVVKRDADTFVVRDLNNVDTVVRLTDRTSVKSKGGFLRGGTNYGQTHILRGLNLEVDALLDLDRLHLVVGEVFERAGVIGHVEFLIEQGRVERAQVWRHRD